MLNPSVSAVEFTDGYGNLCQRLIALPGEFSIRTSADVMTSDTTDVAPGAPFDEVQNLPDSVLTYLLPSRYCESERFFEMGKDIVKNVAPGYDQVDCITDWIRRSVTLDSASDYAYMSAIEVNRLRKGVCRDLAHLGIALCRSLCIPARMVVGYLYGLRPMDLHAWFEAYVGGRWYTFDATQHAQCGGRVAVAYGHDAANVAIFSQFGPELSPTLMQVGVDLLDTAPE